MDEVIRPTPLPLGTKVPPYGEIAAVGITGGERYYWLQRGECTAMLPWSIVEPWYERFVAPIAEPIASL